MSIWSQENVEKLKRLWIVDGLSATEITRRIPGTTRGGVLGKLARLGLMRNPGRPAARTVRPSPPRSPRPPQLHFARRAAPRAAMAARGGASPSSPREDGELHPFEADAITDIAVTVGDPPESERVSLLELQHHHCRFPIGEPVTFCGRHKIDGYPYCLGHARRAFQGFKPPKEHTHG